MGNNLDYAGRPKEGLKSRLGKYTIMAAIGVACVTLVPFVSSEADKSKPVNSLTGRLEQSYQACQEIEDKSQRVDFAHFFYVSCQEVEEMYFTVKN